MDSLGLCFLLTPISINFLNFAVLYVSIYVKSFATKKIDLTLLAKLYLYLWVISIIVGIPHEYLHYYFAKLCGIRTKKTGAITLMGFPLIFFVEPEDEIEKNRRGALIMVSGGLIVDAILLSIAFLTYLFWRNEFTTLFLVVALSVYIYNIAPFYFFVMVDGVRFIGLLILYIKDLDSIRMITKKSY